MYVFYNYSKEKNDRQDGLGPREQWSESV
jgi:hypothetical protein